MATARDGTLVYRTPLGRSYRMPPPTLPPAEPPIKARQPPQCE